MCRLLVLMTLFSTVAMVGTVFPCTSAFAAITTDVERQIGDLPLVKNEILASTSYRGDDLDLAIKDNQIVVTVINSSLNNASSGARETEASTIVAAITKAISNRPEFGIILGVHINYIARVSGSSHTEMVDGIDYRKDPSGNFIHHTS